MSRALKKSKAQVSEWLNQHGLSIYAEKLDTLQVLNQSVMQGQHAFVVGSGVQRILLL